MIPAAMLSSLIESIDGQLKRGAGVSNSFPRDIFTLSGICTLFGSRRFRVLSHLARACAALSMGLAISLQWTATLRVGTADVSVDRDEWCKTVCPCRFSCHDAGRHACHARIDTVHAIGVHPRLSSVSPVLFTSSSSPSSAAVDAAAPPPAAAASAPSARRCSEARRQDGVRDLC